MIVKLRKQWPVKPWTDNTGRSLCNLCPIVGVESGDGMLFARHEYSYEEMEMNRIKFYKRFEKIKEQQKRTCRLISELSEKHEQKVRAL